METAAALVSRPLPRLNKVNGTTYSSISGQNISLKFLHEWPNFENEVLTACTSLDLSGNIPVTDDRDEKRKVCGW